MSYWEKKLVECEGKVKRNYQSEYGNHKGTLFLIIKTHNSYNNQMNNNQIPRWPVYCGQKHIQKLQLGKGNLS
jgi:hypothetical protein